ncbi:hypothetical protein AJ79_08905 [Helicocarpus griseus UAMH5409]|uniref:Amine oxidase domain-containing protein n=1 Tax=Helicocarpus griseus UAMH5409 TaxID=1447875 RepID=A0A2B7WP42_9EURO|nr:hypothetical protein AJ79_08905 [Helicocarpus griseus UAMH5409]
MAPKKVAIVGGECSGLAAFWALKYSGHEVHIFESGNRLSSFTHPMQYEKGGKKIAVDTGLTYLKPSTSPNLYAFLQELQVSCCNAEFSVASSRLGDSFEWKSASPLAAILSRNILRLDMWRILIDIVRFNHFALDLLRSEQVAKRRLEPRRKAKQLHSRDWPQKSIGMYLTNEGYSTAFRDHYIIPIIAFLWSVQNARDALELPIALLLRFMAECGLLQSSLFWSNWMSVRGDLNGLEASITKNTPAGRIHLNTTVHSVREADRPDELVVHWGEAQRESFDHVIMATSSHEALSLISADATDEEIRILSGFQTARAVAILHSDTNLMPKRRRVRATFNHITKISPTTRPSSSNTTPFCTSYYMNRLQNVPEQSFGSVLITINSLSPPHPLLVQGIWEYPLFTFNNQALQSQKLLSRIQNKRGISYCGSWTGYGRYEDAVRSAFQVAVEHLGAELPFDVVESGTLWRGGESTQAHRVPALKRREVLARLLLKVLLAVYWLLGVVRRVVLYFWTAWRGVGEMGEMRKGKWEGREKRWVGR